jgi:hypothetical protein
MAKNQPPPKATIAPLATAVAASIVWDPLGTLNGNRTPELDPNAEKGKKMLGNLGLERQKTKSALKGLADAKAKIHKLEQLLAGRSAEFSQGG